MTFYQHTKALMSLVGHKGKDSGVESDSVATLSVQQCLAQCAGAAISITVDDKGLPLSRHCWCIHHRSEQNQKKTSQ